MFKFLLKFVEKPLSQYAAVLQAAANSGVINTTSCGSQQKCTKNSNRHVTVQDVPLQVQPE